jgi:transcription initiation factor TFIIIB Brf1 subunit/transcription initiation factor TFIIB
MENQTRRTSNGGRRPVNVNVNNTGDSSRIDQQIAYVHNYTDYKMDPSAAPAERFAKALNLLAGKMPREAEQIIGEAVQDGLRSNKIAYYWALCAQQPVLR